MNLEKLFQDVFHVEPGERVLVLTDHPHGDLDDSTAWQERRQMAAERSPTRWVSALDGMIGMAAIAGSARGKTSSTSVVRGRPGCWTSVPSARARIVAIPVAGSVSPRVRNSSRG
jgi:hypothetical protein